MAEQFQVVRDENVVKKTGTRSRASVNPPKPLAANKQKGKVKTKIGVKEGVAEPGKCAYHKALPAAFICNRCGKSICSSCAIRYGEVVFCPQCSPSPSGYQPYAYPFYPSYYPYYPYFYRQYTNVASIGGLLIVLAGVLGFIYIGTMIVVPLGYGVLNPFYFGGPEALFCFTFPLISSVIAMIGGIYGYHKTNFSIAIVGGIFSIFVMGFFIGSVLGLIGLILVGLGRYEFEDIKPPMALQPGRQGL